MSTNQDIVQEGIAAYKAGEKGRAKELLTQAVQQNPNSEQAWYYLAALYTNMAQRKDALEHVLKINPDNTKAQEMLDKTKERLAEQGAGAAAPAAESTKPRAVSASSSGEGFKLPVDIPGAPEKVTPQELISSGIALLQNSVGIFLKRPGAYEDEIQRATWWRFWLTVATGSVVSAVLFALEYIFFRIHFGVGFNVISFLLLLILSVPINMIAVYAGCYASYWYATTQAHGVASLVQHSQAMAAAWLPGNVVGAAIGAVVALLFGSAFSFDLLLNPAVWGLLGLGLIVTLIVTIAVALYTLSIQVKGVQILYKFTGNPLWVTTASMLIVTGLVYGILARFLPG
jgi:hypothetical protein